MWYRFGEREFGHVTNNGHALNLDHAASIEERQYSAPAAQGTFTGGRTSAHGSGDFAGGLERVNSTHQGSRAGTYTARAGDSLQGVAQQLYGDASLWYRLAEANPGISTGALTPGQQIQLPSGVIRNTNAAQSFKPYDPARAIGDLSPTSPAPPQDKKGCGVVGAILLAAIAIAVAAVVGPAVIGAAATKTTLATGLTATLGSTGAGIVGGAIAGAAGSIVSQGVGVATGIQEKFSFKGVALAALGGAVGGGLRGVKAFGKVAEGTETSLRAAGNAAVRGALGSALTQGIAAATGLQSKFSWAGVAAAGVAAGIGQGLGGKLDPLSGDGASAGNIASHTAVGAASLFASAATRGAIEGSSFARNIEAGLPDVIGQVIGRIAGSKVYDPAVASAKKAAAQHRAAHETVGPAYTKADFKLAADLARTQGQINGDVVAQGQGKNTVGEGVEAIVDASMLRTKYVPLHPYAAAGKIPIRTIVAPQSLDETETEHMNSIDLAHAYAEANGHSQAELDAAIATINAGFAGYYELYAGQKTAPPPMQTDQGVEDDPIIVTARHRPGEVASEGEIAVHRYETAIELRKDWLANTDNLKVSLRLDQEAADRAAWVAAEQRKVDLAVGGYLGLWTLPLTGIAALEGGVVGGIVHGTSTLAAANHAGGLAVFAGANKLPVDYAFGDGASNYLDYAAIGGELTRGGVSLLRNRSAAQTVTLYRVDDIAHPARITADGTVPIVTTRNGGERALFVGFDSKRATEFALVNRNGNATITSVEVDASLLDKLRGTSVIDTSAAARAQPNAPLRVDVNKGSDQFGLRSPQQIQMLRQALWPSTVRVTHPSR